jgi:hypothetical protein
MSADAKQHAFNIGQPLWTKDPSDRRCWVVVDYFDDMMKLVESRDPTGPIYFRKPEHFTDQPPYYQRFHPDQRGIIHFTATGRAVMEISGGRK